MNLRVVVSMFLSALFFSSCTTISTDSPLITEKTAERIQENGGIEGCFTLFEKAVLVAKKSSFEQSQGLSAQGDLNSYLIFTATEAPKELRVKRLEKNLYLCQIKGKGDDENAYDYIYLYLRIVSEQKKKKFWVYLPDMEYAIENPPSVPYEKIKQSMRFDAVTSVKNRDAIVDYLKKVEGASLEVLKSSENPVFFEAEPISKELLDANWKVDRKKKLEADLAKNKQMKQEVEGIIPGAKMTLDTGSGVLGFQDARIVKIRKESPRVLVSVIETQEAKWVKPSDLKTLSAANDEKWKAAGKVLDYLLQQ